MYLNVSLWVVCMWRCGSLYVYLIVSTRMRCVIWILYCGRVHCRTRWIGFVHLRWAELCAHHSHACVLSTNVHLIPPQLARCQRRHRREGVWCPISVSVESELHSFRLELSVTCRLQLSLLCCHVVHTYSLTICLCQSCNGVSRCPPNARTTMHVPTEQRLFGMSARECSSTAPGTNCLLRGADGTDW